MPLCKEPDTLFNLSLEKFASWFMGSWKCGEECVPISVQDEIFNRNSSREITAFSRKVASLKLNFTNLFDDLPVVIFNKIVPKVAAAFVCCTMNRFCLICLRKLLAVIMTKKLKHWDIHKFLRVEWYITSRLIGIKSVILYQIPTIKNIVHLRLGSLCDDSILRCVGENCHLLEYLDIEDSKVTDKGLMYLIPSENSAGCPKLQELILGEDKIKISSHTVALLLKSLPDIVYINYQNMKPAVLEVFDINESEKSLVLQLKRLDYESPWPNIYWNFEEIIKLSKLCPNLEQLKIGFTEERKRDVLALKHFACLSRLHLVYKRNTIFPVAEAKQYFKEHCMQLTSLTVTCDVLDTTFFSILGKHCSSLENLHIECTELCDSKPFNRDEENNLKILSTFTLRVMYESNNSNIVVCDVLYSMLKSTDRLTEMTLELPSQCLSHQDLLFLLDVVDVHLLHSLEIRIMVFGYSRFNLTLESVYLILEKCPLLKSLGNLKHWNVVSSDVEKLKRGLKYSNYDIEIYK